MAWKKTNDIHYQNIADSIRYAKDGTEYRTTLERVREEIMQDNEYFDDISEAVQSKTGHTESYTKDDLANVINEEWVQPTLIEKTFTANDTYSAEDDNANGYSEVTVAVPQAITKLVDGTITEYIDDEIVSVRDYAFYYCGQLNRVSMAEVTSIGDGVFAHCGTITQLDIPKVSTMGTIAFQFTPLIHPVGEPFVFPNVLSIGTECFGRYNKIPPHDVGFYFPKLISMGYDAWRQRQAKVILKQQCELVRYDTASFSRTVYYVPQRYFNWYTTTTNWSAGYTDYPNSIQTIEDNIDYLVSLGYDRAELLKDEEVPTT